MAPVTSLSDKVDVFDQSDLEIVTISVKYMEQIQNKGGIEKHTPCAREATKKC